MEVFMKKFAILGFVVLGMVSTLAALDGGGKGIVIGSFGRYIFSPIGVSGTVGEDVTADDLYTTGVSHAAFPPGGKISLLASGATEHFGFSADFAYMAGSVQMGDEAQVWVKFNDALTIRGGYVLGNALTGKIGGGKFITMDQEDAIFTRFHPRGGILLELTPVKNLYIGGVVDSGKFELVDMMNGGVRKYNESGYQASVGYLFGNAGHLRLQYLDKYAEATDTFYDKTIEGAFAFTGVENLTIDAGVKIPVEKTDTSFTSGALAVQYVSGDLSLMGRAAGYFYEDDYQVKAGSVIKYNLNNPLYLGLEAAYDTDNPLTPAKDAKLQLIPFVGFNFGPGEFRCGIYGEMNFNDPDPAYKIEIPLLFEAVIF
jgi:hypothetical protein